MNSIAVLLLPPILLVPVMGILSRFRGTSELTRELRRKALHVGIGLTALSFPAIFHGPVTIVIALVLVVAWMIAVRTIEPLKDRFGACLHDTRRESHGELYFALALSFLLLVAGDEPTRYVIPLLILTLADTAAAIVGRAWPVAVIGGLAREKTQSGAAAFFLVAYLVTVSTLIAMTTITPGAAIGIALLVAAGTCLAESISHRGIDNVVVPLVAYLFLVFLGV